MKKRMTRNEDIIAAFIDGADAGEVNNLQIVNGQLVNYNTVIAERSHDGIIVNSTRYSVTTSKIQSKLRGMISIAGRKYHEVSGIRQGFRGKLAAEMAVNA